MRIVRIFATGVAGLGAAVLFTAHSNLVVVAFSATILLLVLVGFLIPVPEWLPCVPSAWEEPWNDGTPMTAPFPRMVVFQPAIRNLWILILAPLYALALAAIMLSALQDPAEQDIGVQALIIVLFVPSLWKLLTYAAVFFSWSWFRERLLLRKAEVGLGTRMSSPDFWRRISYQYRDVEGERRGGVAHLWGPLSAQFPVFMHGADPDFSKPGFGFLFHKFGVVDAKAAASATLAVSQQRVFLQRLKPTK